MKNQLLSLATTFGIPVDLQALRNDSKIRPTTPTTSKGLKLTEWGKQIDKNFLRESIFNLNTEGMIWHTERDYQEKRNLL